MTPMVERLADLRRHVDHLKGLQPRVTGAGDLESDLSLHNDVLFSLLSVCQLVIDIAGELSSHEGLRFDDYTSAVRNLRKMDGFPSELVDELSRLPGFRNVLIHDYVELDFEAVLEALTGLEPVERFIGIVAQRLEAPS
ncbi:MAG: DUF86 domain-containing protein [Gemmatimonadota bacterium]